MAITINVNGVNSGAGNNNQNPTPPNNPVQQQPQSQTSASPAPQPTQQQPHTATSSTHASQPQSQQPNNNTVGNQQQQQPITSTPQNNQNVNNQPNRQTIQYTRPDFAPYRQSNVQGVNNPLPMSDRLVNDVRAEISRRGIILVPGTQNFSTMLNTMHQNQRSSVMGQIDNQYERKMVDIDTRKDALMYEIKSRLDLAKDDELSGTNDPFKIQQINTRYDRLFDREAGKVDRLFAGEYDAVEQEHNAQKADAEQRLTEALQRLTEELSQGNKDSYLNNLRDKYKEQVWRRDNAATEEEVREASREAAKIQERMQRAMGGSGGVSPVTSRLVGTLGAIATTGINTAIQLDRIGIKEDYVGFDMASSVLNGNATAAIRQRNAIEEQKNTTLWTGGGAIAGLLAGAAAGSLVGGVGAVPGAIVGLALGTLGGVAGGVGGNAIAHMANRNMMIEDERTRVADLWKQEESRIMQFNDLAMLYRGRSSNPNDIGGIRQTLVDSSGERPFVSPYDEYDLAPMDDIRQTAMERVVSGVDKKYAEEKQNIGGISNIFTRSDSQLDLYDLGYTAPEFAQQAARRIKQRGFVSDDSLENALVADSLERVFSMNPGSLGQLSAYDRFGKNNANQDFVNLAYTLDRLGTTGMRNGSWARSDEFASYMTQLQSQQRGTFLTVDNERAGRQIATGQAIFGDKFGAEAMQGIQAVNQQVQKPGGGFQQTLLYDVIQELFPETRGDIGKIMEYQYSDKRGIQDEIQQAFAKRMESIYGGVDTTSGLLAMMDVYGIDNPNILKPIATQLTNGGLEEQRLDKKHRASEEASVLNNGYTPEITQRVNAIADQQMKSLLGYQEEITTVVKNILDKVETSIAEKLQEAVDNLKQ